MSIFPPRPHLTEPLDLDIDTSSPDDARSSFLTTNYNAVLPTIRARFPNIDPLYMTKIFRGTIRPEGLVWLDVNREDATPADFSDLAHMMYCFEVYGQILCIFASPQGVQLEKDLQHALADYRIRVLKLSKVATFESLRDWHKAFIEAQIREGQDKSEGWRQRRGDLGPLLKGYPTQTSR